MVYNIRMDTDKVNRLEIIDHRACNRCSGKGYLEGNECTACYGMGSAGRKVIVAGPAYKQPDNATVSVSLQDDGRTLKVFISDKDV